jgi:hypothetical protein
MPPRLTPLAPIAAGGSSRTMRDAFRDVADYAFSSVRAAALRAAASSPESAPWMAPLQAAPPAPRAALDHTPTPQVRACAYVIESACTLSPCKSPYKSLTLLFFDSLALSPHLSVAYVLCTHAHSQSLSISAHPGFPAGGSSCAACPAGSYSRSTGFDGSFLISVHLCIIFHLRRSLLLSSSSPVFVSPCLCL